MEFKNEGENKVMRKTALSLLLAICMFAFASVAAALDPFMNYRNLSPTADENIPVVPDVNFAIKQGYINVYVLVANTNKTVTVPAGAKFCIISANSDIWVRVGGAASVPAADITNGTGSELNPAIRYIGDASTIGVISESGAKLSIMFYE